MREDDASMPSRREHPQLFIQRLPEPIEAPSAVAGSDQTATTTISGVLDHTPEGSLAGHQTHSLLAAPPERSIENLEVPITIRPARSADSFALAKLAELDSADVPSVPLLIAEANGELRAAVSVHDGAVIADPFTHTIWVVQLLQARAAQLRGDGPLHRRHFLRTLTRRRRWAM